MHRVELKVIMPNRVSAITPLGFLMHRVELKVTSSLMVVSPIVRFLMHRVELKD